MNCDEDENIKETVLSSFSMGNGVRKRTSKCNKCKASVLFNETGDILFERTELCNVIHVRCTSNSCRGFIVFCIACKSRGNRKSNFKCKCADRMDTESLRTRTHHVSRKQTSSRVGTESLRSGTLHVGRKRTAEDLKNSLAKST